MSNAVASIEERLQHLEQQNERILGLLEKLADSSFSYKGKKLPSEKPDSGRVHTSELAPLPILRFTHLSGCE